MCDHCEKMNRVAQKVAESLAHAAGTLESPAERGALLIIAEAVRITVTDEKGEPITRAKVEERGEELAREAAVSMCRVMRPQEPYTAVEASILSGKLARVLFASEALIDQALAVEGGRDPDRWIPGIQSHPVVAGVRVEGDGEADVTIAVDDATAASASPRPKGNGVAIFGQARPDGNIH